MESGEDATVVFVPTERRPPPPVETGDIEVTAPPQLPGRAPVAASSWLIPLATTVVMAAMTTVLYRSAAPRTPVFLAVPAMMLVSVGMTAVFGRRGGANIDADRRDYLEYLSVLRVRVTETAAAQRVAQLYNHPDPAALWSLAGEQRMWERRATDPDFARVRVGVRTQPLATNLIAPPRQPSGRQDFVTATAMRRFVETYSTVPEIPAVLDLRAAEVVAVDGDPGAARGLLRAMICQLAVWHRPDELRIAAVVDEHRLGDWDWLKWLPHHQHPSTTDALGPARLMYPDPARAEAALTELSVGPAVPDHRPGALIMVLDGDAYAGGEPSRIGARIAGVTVVAVGAGRGAAGPRLHVHHATLTVGRSDHDNDDIPARPDFLALAEARMCARRLAGYRLGGPGGASWPARLGIGDPAGFDPPTVWRARAHRDRLRVPIGATAAGAAAEIDIKEAAEHGMGPHGLCIGATGSGKSELLRVIALGMIATHSPQELNLVLIDFKGGATFLGLEQARHVAAIITNLANEAPLVARMHDALAGEMTRRQELLRQAGNYVSAAAYENARRAGAPLRALPSLFIIVDEFSELLSQHPDFVDMFVAIGRLGRSLGMHLLLASQRLDEGRLRGLDTHLSYRICLKTLSAAESRIVLGTSQAYELPNTPGAGYLWQATGETIRFDAAFVSAPHPCARTATAAVPGVPVSRARVFTAAPCAAVRGCEPAEAAHTETLLQTMLARLAGHGPPAHRVWLPPLGAAPTLAALLADETAESALTVPVGLVDRPFEQRSTPMVVDLSGAAGNVAVIGGPQAGKSTALCTLITALAATHDPEHVQIHCIDLGGGMLESVRPLPHVGSVAGRADRELITRIIAELEGVVARRENRTADGRGELFLVLDGWDGLRHDFGAVEESVTALAARGLSFGVHVVLSATRWAEIRPALRGQIGTRIELRLGDPADSEIDRRRAQQVPGNTPGRGLTQDGLHMVIAVPRLVAAQPGPGPAQDGARTGELLRRRYGDRAAAPVRLLPARIDDRAVVESAGAQLRTRILIGIEEHQLRPVALDFVQQPHLLILGDNVCGKTSVLRALCREIARTATGEQAQLLLVDYRRSLLGVAGTGQLRGYAPSAAALEALLPDLLAVLRARLPGPQTTQQQLRDRSWWCGPEIYLLVDDYDLVAAATGNPLAALGEFLPHAGDIGLRVVVARRTGGAARALFEPLLAGLRDLGCAALMMSGNPDDGALIGSVRPVPLPPGRGILCTRSGGEQRIQVCWSPPP